MSSLVNGSNPLLLGGFPFTSINGINLKQKNHAKVLVALVTNDQYECLSYIAGGGFGEVYKCRNTQTMELRALKILNVRQMRNKYTHRWEEKRTQLYREICNARKIAELGCINLTTFYGCYPNIVSELDFDTCNFLVLDFELLPTDKVDNGEGVGYELWNYVDEIGRERTWQDGTVSMHCSLPETEALAIYAQIVEGTKRLHLCDIVHRDIKPENVRLIWPTGFNPPPLKPGDPPADVPLVKLVDYGASKDVSMASNPHTNIGTSMYMAPEVRKSPNPNPNGNAYDDRADVYSIGVSLSYMLLGRDCFNSSVMSPVRRLEIFEKHLTEDTRKLLGCLISPSTKEVYEQPQAITNSIVGSLLDPNPKTRLRLQPDVHVAVLDQSSSAADDGGGGDDSNSSTDVARDDEVAIQDIALDDITSRRDDFDLIDTSNDA